MKVFSQLSLTKLSFNENTETHLVINLSAPLVDWQVRRLPICLMLAIDVSGSMNGSKLKSAKESAMKIVDNLTDTDLCGVVAFESSVHLVSEPLIMNSSNKESLKSKIKDIGSNGLTNFAGGMTLGLRELNGKSIPENTLVRLIMLTDGQPNIGPSDASSLNNLLNTEIGKATVSSFGYGSDADQDLMATVAKTGRGNFAFIENADNATTAYAKELGGLLSMYARNITIQFKTEDQTVELVTDVPMQQKDNINVVSLSDILSEENRNIVISLKNKALSQADELFEPITRKISIVTSYDLLKFDGTTEKITEVQDVEFKFVTPEEAQKIVDKSLDEIVGKAQMIRAQLSAQQKADAGDYKTATYLMNNVSTDFTVRGLDGLSKTSSKIGSKMNSATSYTMSAGYRSSTAAGGTRGYGTSALDEEAANDLDQIGISLNNTAQEDMIQIFTSPNPVNPSSK